MSEFDATSLGSPALKIQGFQLWIHGRQFPESRDFWDANWLNVTAHCGAVGASIWVRGAVLMNTDVDRFSNACEQLHKDRSDKASLEPLEPNLRVELTKSDRRGHIRISVHLTPDQMTQKHELRFEIDQSYLPDIIRQCRAILEEFPVMHRP